VSDFLRGERERVLLSEQEWPSAERERVVSEGEDTDEITTCVSDVRKKVTLGGNQRRHILQACVSSTKLSVMDFIARYQCSSD
jgi:tetrahydromethanopterin S-methyltransferase subunit F